jgi:2-acylglycerol O-acyltransferase 2
MRQKQYDSGKQYLIACHPHGFLCENVANLFSRSSNMDFKKTGICPPLPGMGPLSCCFAPAVGWYPLYCELGGKFITDASMGSMRKVLKEGRSALVCPGGFSEAVYCGASEKYDHAYLDGRMGFLKLAIEFGIDVAPIYGFGITSAYSTGKMWEKGRHQRSVRAQDQGLPGVLPIGRLGTAVPFNEDYVSVLLDPFPTSKYKVEQLEQCSQDYSAYLQRCFDAYKACHPTEAHKELLIIGKNVDHNMAVAKLRSRL